MQATPETGVRCRDSHAEVVPNAQLSTTAGGGDQHQIPNSGDGRPIANQQHSALRGAENSDRR